jgi:hypothetical protein
VTLPLDPLSRLSWEPNDAISLISFGENRSPKLHEFAEHRFAPSPSAVGHAGVNNSVDDLDLRHFGHKLRHWQSSKTPPPGGSVRLRSLAVRSIRKVTEISAVNRLCSGGRP